MCVCLSVRESIVDHERHPASNPQLTHVLSSRCELLTRDAGIDASLDGDMQAICLQSLRSSVVFSEGRDVDSHVAPGFFFVPRDAVTNVWSKNIENRISLITFEPSVKSV